VLVPPNRALWLIPDEPRLQQVVDALSAQYGAPRFEAHLTLLSGLMLPHQDSIACSELARLAAASAPVTLPVTGTGESDLYFETAFVRCAESAELIALREHARRAFGSGRVAAIGPHVSLLYARLPRVTRRAITRSHAIAGALRFSMLALVRPGPLGWNSVEQWRVLCRDRLHG
jgi:hypothetical protein